MIIINKKRLTFIFLMIVVSVISFEMRGKKDYVSVSSLPVTNKVIVLDAGHGKPDERALRLPKTQATNLLQEKLLTNGIKTLYN